MVLSVRTVALGSPRGFWSPQAPVILRSTAWDGLPPSVGDVVDHPDGILLVVSVAEGPGVGQWTLVCEPVRVIKWRV